MAKKKKEPKTKPTEEVQAKIIQALSIGAHYEEACGYAGLDFSFFTEWMAQGREDKSGCLYEFYMAVRKAECSFVVGGLAKMEKAANSGDWQAIGWKLERRRPGEWGRKKEEPAKKKKGFKISF